ncbi:hypothetical protein [Sphingobium sp. Z007]|uniref:hypothetical protein n=1 Tax=Sphingobium sp. Z007 TaxID=627495 RepID=UPI000B49851B|nr:hypothetical protein [Sphingobium sp. Z007]
MATIYENFASAVTTLYAGPLGGTFILRRTSGGGYDANGEIVPVTTRDLRVRGIVKEKEFWNNGALLGSRTVALLDNKHEPFPDDLLLVGQTTYTVDTAKAVAPNGVTVIRYEAVLK